MLWTCLWCNLNTGFWNIQPASSLDDWQNLIRAVLPFLVLPAACLILLTRKRLHLPRRAPSRLLLAYGAIAALATIFSPQPMWSLYWSITFLATILTAWTFIDQRNSVASARQLLEITWVATFVVAAIIGYQSRNLVFGEAASAYGVDVTLNGLSRSSGVARWAAVPGLVCLIRAYHTRRAMLIAFFLSVAAVAFYIVYRMQSRGAVFGSVAALAFVLLVSSRMRRYALPFAVVAIIAIILIDTPTALSNQVVTYLERGGDREGLVTMTGRTNFYELGVAAFQDAPLFGRGQWADRLLGIGHIHNSFLQALLNGGVIGALPYFASWAAGWMLFYRLYRKRMRLAPKDRVCLLEAGTVMMFFTLRAIPETTTASFAVDLLVMVAVYVYMEALAVSIPRRPALRLVPANLRGLPLKRTVRLPQAS